MKKAMVIAATALTLVVGSGTADAATKSWFTFGDFSREVLTVNADTWLTKMERRFGCMVMCQTAVTTPTNEVETEIAPTPLPAGGFLLLAGLGAFAVTKRRKR